MLAGLNVERLALVTTQPTSSLAFALGGLVARAVPHGGSAPPPVGSPPPLPPPKSTMSRLARASARVCGLLAVKKTQDTPRSRELPRGAEPVELAAGPEEGAELAAVGAVPSGWGASGGGASGPSEHQRIQVSLAA